MKKLFVTVSLLLLSAITGLPALANPYGGYNGMMGPEMMGQGMMGPGMMGPGYGDFQGMPVDEAKLKAYREEIAKHYKDTAEQRREIAVKQHEMATLLIKTTTTKKELLEKQKELQALMNGMQREELSFRWDIREKYPEMTQDMYGGCLGPAAGFGGVGMMNQNRYGRGMMDRDDYDHRGQGMMNSDK